MKKSIKAALTLSMGLGAGMYLMGGAPASMQTNQNQNQNQNQNTNANRRGSNTNGNANRNMNGNANRNMGGNMNGGSMSSGSMNSGNAGMTGNLTRIGNLSVEEFNRINEQGNAAVAAITPTSTQLSNADRRLMMEVAMNGMRQLEVSRAALQKATTPEARLLAQSEVEEQTGVAAKLTQMAAAKGVTLPTAPDSKTRSMVAKMQRMSAGRDFDRTYVRESGVKGHERLERTMSTVMSRAADPDMKALAAATMPVIRTHLQVSRSVVDGLSRNNRAGSSNNSNMR